MPTAILTPRPTPVTPPFIKWVVADGVREKEVQAAKEGVQIIYDFAKEVGLPESGDEVRFYLDYDTNRLARAFANETGWNLSDAKKLWLNKERGNGTAAPNSIYAIATSPSEMSDPYFVERLKYVAAHETVHTVYQIELLGLTTSPSWFTRNPQYMPFWLSEGMAELYLALAWDHAGLKPYYLSRLRVIDFTNKVNLPMGAIEEHPRSYGSEDIRRCVYRCGFVATELLASHIGLRGLTDYHTLMHPRSTWKQAFQNAYEVSITKFYDLFEEHRAAGFPKVELSEVSNWIRARPTCDTDLHWEIAEEVPQNVIRTTLDSACMMHDYLISLGMPDMSKDMSMYLDSSIDKLVEAISKQEGVSLNWAISRFNHGYPTTRGDDWITFNASDKWFSKTKQSARMIFVGQELFHQYRDMMFQPSYHYSRIHWMQYGVARFLAHKALSEYGVFDYAVLRGLAVSDVRGVNQPLSEMVTWDGFTRVNGAFDYSMLAAEILAAHSGQDALIRYYTILQTGSDWRGAFRKSFGMTVDQFYDLFDAYRSAGFPKLDTPKSLNGE